MKVPHLVALGRTVKASARELGLHSRTVETHVGREPGQPLTRRGVGKAAEPGLVSRADNLA